MSFPQYPEYKDSGVEWLGKVPEHWEFRKIAHGFNRIGSGTTPPSNEQRWYEGGSIPWVTTSELREKLIIETKKSITNDALSEFTSLQIHPPGSLAIAMYGATIGRLGVFGVSATTNQACCVLSGSKSIRSRFAFYWLLAFKSEIVFLYATGGGQPNINQETIANLRLPAPSLEDQAKISVFLDHETARIDALIDEQKRLIELLKEKRQAVISHAVTKGLDPDVPMKDSGVEWLGDVPAHWEVRKIAHSFDRVGSGTTPPSNEQKWYEGGSIPWVTTSELREELILKTKKYITNEALSEFTALQIHPPGSLAIAMYGATIGRLGVFGVSATTNQACCVLSRGKSIDSRFAFYWFLSFKGEIVFYYATGGGQPNINQETIASLRLPAPSLEDQAKIAAFLDYETAQIKALIKEGESVIKLLQERRSALISAAVTGKIDVRNWQPGQASEHPEFPMVAEAHATYS